MSKRKQNTQQEPAVNDSDAAGNDSARDLPVENAAPPEALVARKPRSSKTTSSTTGKTSSKAKDKEPEDNEPASARPGRTGAKRSSAAAKAAAKAAAQDTPAAETAGIQATTPAAPPQAAQESASPEDAPATSASTAPKKRSRKAASKPQPATEKVESPSAATEESNIVSPDTASTPDTASAVPEESASAASTPAKSTSRRGKGKSEKSQKPTREQPKSEQAESQIAQVESTVDAAVTPQVQNAQAASTEPHTPVSSDASDTASATASAESAPAESLPPVDRAEAPAAPTKSGRNRRGRGGKRKSQTNGDAATGATSAPVVDQRNESATEGKAAATTTRAPLPPMKPAGRRWYKVDLHMHTMASSDYEDPQLSWLDWLRTVAERGLEIVAIADHNTVRGIAAIRNEIEWLTRLESVNRLNEQERADLTAWRELSNRVLVLPGFEFTATFGFHILGIFPPETSVRTLEQLLLKLNVPAEKLDVGSTETGASADVLTAYRVIHEAGGLAIAAHANSTHGVALRDFPFGGQTKIAYTQDPNLDALEVTDLEGRGFSTARFFNGTKTEYPRRMHCIQGSDSHRVNTDPRNPKRLGIGERATEMLLDEPSFNAIANLLRSTSFDRTRPARPKDKPFDAFAKAREEGNSLVQAFHENVQKPGAKLDAILNDVCALANSAGGSIFVGASAGSKHRPSGVPRPRQVEDMIRTAVGERLTPPLDLRIDTVQSEGTTILRLRVPKGEERPYCVDDNKFYVRDEDETSLAVRDEIIAMVLETMNQRTVEVAPGIESLTRTDGAPITEAPERTHTVAHPDARAASRRSKKNGSGSPATDVQTQIAPQADAFYLPQMGVEIVESETRNGNQYHTIRDLRTGNVVRNISRRSAKDLWSYAIKLHETGAVKPGAIKWQGDVGLIHFEKRAGKVRYDLALREGDNTRIFYGVTEDGMEGPWAVFVQEEPAA